MKKITAGLACVILSVIIALISVACGGSGGELTYTGSYQTSSSTQSVNPSQTGATGQSAETVFYHLTTQQGETVQVLSTTVPTTEVPTMSYDPVTVPPMSTQSVSQGTTAYVPPTYSGSEKNPVTTQATTEATTEKPKEKKIKYKSVNGNADGGLDGEKIKLWVDNIFGDKIKEKTSTVTVNYASTSYKVKCKVLSKLYAGEQVEIDVDVPSDLMSAVESSSEQWISVIVPQGTIVSEDNVSNKEFKVTVSAADF